MSPDQKFQNVIKNIGYAFMVLILFLCFATCGRSYVCPSNDVVGYTDKGTMKCLVDPDNQHESLNTDW